jgi:hypothetical protein
LLFCSGCSFSLPVVSTNDLRDYVDYDALERLSSKEVMWGLGKNTNEYKQPIDALNANDLYRDYGAYFVGDKDPIIYLTFDNGYEAGYTSKILDTLKENNVKDFSLFLTGRLFSKSPCLLDAWAGKLLYKQTFVLTLFESSFPGKKQ